MSNHPGDACGSYDDLISTAIAAALRPVASMESEWDMPKLSKKVRKYFISGSNGLDFQGQALHELVNQYADNVFVIIFQALHDKPWINEVNFVQVLEACVKDRFPKPMLNSVSPRKFESIIDAAHKRAFEEQRFSTILWAVAAEHFKQPKAMKKVRDAFEAGRKKAMKKAVKKVPVEMQDFLDDWVCSSVACLDAETGGAADSLLQSCDATNFVLALVNAGALPPPLTEDSGISLPNLHAVESCVTYAYSRPPWRDGGMSTPTPHSQRQAAAASEGGGKPGKQQSTDTFEAGKQMGDQRKRGHCSDTEDAEPSLSSHMVTRPVVTAGVSGMAGLEKLSHILIENWMALPEDQKSQALKNVACQFRSRLPAQYVLQMCEALMPDEQPVSSSVKNNIAVGQPAPSSLTNQSSARPSTKRGSPIPPVSMAVGVDKVRVKIEETSPQPHEAVALGHSGRRDKTALGAYMPKEEQSPSPGRALQASASVPKSSGKSRHKRKRVEPVGIYCSISSVGTARRRVRRVSTAPASMAGAMLKQPEPVPTPSCAPTAEGQPSFTKPTMAPDHYWV